MLEKPTACLTDGAAAVERRPVPCPTAATVADSNDVVDDAKTDQRGMNRLFQSSVRATGFSVYTRHVESYAEEQDAQTHQRFCRAQNEAVRILSSHSFTLLKSELSRPGNGFEGRAAVVLNTGIGEDLGRTDCLYLFRSSSCLTDSTRGAC